MKPPYAPGRGALGHIPRLLRDPLKFYWQAGTGGQELVRLDLKLRDGYYVCTPEGVRHVLQGNHANYSKDTLSFRPVRELMGGGLFTSEGETWKRQKRALQPAFVPQAVSALERDIQAVCVEWVGAWRSVPRLNFSREVSRLVIDLLSRVVVGIDLGGELDLVDEAFSWMQHDLYRAALRDPRAFWPLTARKRRNLQARIRGVLARAVGRSHRSSFVRHLVGEGDLTEVALDEILTLLLVGSETTAVALAWAVHAVGRDPAVGEKLRRQGVAYARLVFQETLRLHTPTWKIGRRALRDDRIGGYDVPAGAEIHMSPWVLHRHPSYWRDERAFRPERFAEDPSPVAYFPYGTGARMCIGSHLSLLVAERVLVSLPPYMLEDPSEVGGRPQIVLRPERDVWIRWA